MIRFVQSKLQVKEIVKLMIMTCVIGYNLMVGAIVTDNGSEYVNDDLDTWLSDRNVLHELSCVYTPQQNGMVERGNRTVPEGIRTLLSESGLPLDLWAEAASTVIYAYNRLPRKNGKEARYTLFHKRIPKVENLRIFGQRAVMLDKKSAW